MDLAVLCPPGRAHAQRRAGEHGGRPLLLAFVAWLVVLAVVSVLTASLVAHAVPSTNERAPRCFQLGELYVGSGGFVPIRTCGEEVRSAPPDAGDS